MNDDTFEEEGDDRTTIDSVRGALGLALHPPAKVIEELLRASSNGSGHGNLDFETFAFEILC